MGGGPTQPRTPKNPSSPPSCEASIFIIEDNSKLMFFVVDITKFHGQAIKPIEKSKQVMNNDEREALTMVTSKHESLTPYAHPSTVRHAERKEQPSNWANVGDLYSYIYIYIHGDLPRTNLHTLPFPVSYLFSLDDASKTLHIEVNSVFSLKISNY